jgi:beta-glucosidase
MKLRLGIAALLLSVYCFAQDNPPATVVPAINEGPTKAGDYDWMKRHEDVVARVKQGDVGLLMIGDSITHGWDSELWKRYYEPRKAVNLGFGWDGTQHVLWRLEHGEVDNIKPKAAVLMIGTNNIPYASAEDTYKGVAAIVTDLQKRLPETKILLLAVFPRGETAGDPLRSKLADLNSRLNLLGSRSGVEFLNINDRFMDNQGTISKSIMPDFLHPNRAGYKIWAEAMEPRLSRIMGDKPILPADE